MVRKFYSKMFNLLYRSIPPNDENVTSMQQMINQARRTHFYRDTILPKIALIKETVNLQSLFHSPKYTDQDESPLHRVINTGKCAPAHELRSHVEAEWGTGVQAPRTQPRHWIEMTGQLHAPGRSTPGATAHAVSSIGPTVGPDAVEKNAPTGIEPWLLRSSSQKSRDYN
jgi:hypothetical protein